VWTRVLAFVSFEGLTRFLHELVGILLGFVYLFTRLVFELIYAFVEAFGGVFL
jgi:hypothetical protein